MRGFFVTGTDTDCGKTRVACALIHALRNQQLKVAPFKPVAAGAQLIDGEMRNNDVLQLIAASASDQPYSLINPYCYEVPIAPHLAAEELDESIDLQQISQNAKIMASSADLLLAEGAGGWLVPLGGGRDIADVAADLQLPVILVVGLKLGCLNHARLSESMILQRGLKVAGWVGSLVDKNMAYQKKNVASLHSLLKSPCLGVLSHLGQSETGAEMIEIDKLLKAL